MKTCCIALNSNLIHNESQSKIINFLNTSLYEIGEKFSLISYFDNNLDKIKNIFQDNYDLIFFIGSNQSIYNHNIKDNLSRIIGEKLNNDQTCYSTLKKYCNNNNINFSVEEECEVMIPTNAIPLVTDTSYHNGFMYKFNSSYIVFLPDNYEFVKFNYLAYILPLIKDLINNNEQTQVIRAFGLLEKDLKALLAEFTTKDDISIGITSYDLDNTIYIRYKDNADRIKVQETISNIVSKINKFIYSLENESIYQMACNLLAIQKKKVIIGETLTAGNITRKLAEMDTNNIESNIYLNIDNMIKNLKIDPKVIDNFGKFSVNTVYELANSLLEKSECNIVMFVLGDINNSDICYVAVGDLDGIHVYKNKIQKDNPNLQETLAKTAIFYLIKKLKQNSLQFV